MSTTLLWLAGVTLVGLVVRAIPVALADFPLNDGGLFLTMVMAVEEADWALPVSVAWNGTQLPFTYPPLAFYVVGWADAYLGIDPLALFRFFPLVASTLVVPAVFLLGRSLLRSDLGGLTAALAYAVTTGSFVWLVQGGGISRAPGMLLAVLTLWQTVHLVRSPTPRRAGATGALAGLTILTHPAAALFTAISAFLIWFFEGRSLRSLKFSTAALGVALLVATPWAGAVIQHHGLAGLLDVQNNGPDPRSTLLAMVVGRLTGNPFVDPLALLGLGMAILCLTRRRFLLPIWLLAAAFLAWQYAMVPLGLLVGFAAVDLSTLRDSVRRRAAQAGAPAVSGTSRWGPGLGLGLLGVILLVEAGAAGLAVLNPGAPLDALSPERRDAMAWIEANLEDDARFAVVTGDSWAVDPDSEWFPVLAQRVSVGTVQGSEWLGGAAFREQLTAHGTLQACVAEGSGNCVREWLADWPADYVFIPKGRRHGPNSPPDCCDDLRAGLLADPAFTRVYDGPGATIFRVNSMAAGTPE
ncbi:MAG: glycosyltransferase family 39 protein [Chloroflexota bacterium]